MDLHERTARTIYSTLNDIAEDTFAGQEPAVQELYSSTAEKVVAELAQAAADSGDTAAAEWLAKLLPAAQTSIRDSEGAGYVEDLLVSPLPNRDWFVTGTTNVDVATGAVIQHGIDTDGEASFFGGRASELIASTPVSAADWVEAAGPDGEPTLRRAISTDDPATVFSGVLFTRQPVDEQPVADGPETTSTGETGGTSSPATFQGPEDFDSVLFGANESDTTADD